MPFKLSHIKNTHLLEGLHTLAGDCLLCGCQAEGLQLSARCLTSRLTALHFCFHLT